MESLGAIVRNGRKKSGLTQIELARLAGVGKTAVFDIEKGKSTIRLATLLRVLEVLNIRVSLHGPLGEVVTLQSTEDESEQEEGRHATR